MQNLLYLSLRFHPHVDVDDSQTGFSGICDGFDLSDFIAL